MSAQPVEWVLVIYYGPSAYRATYGRLDGPPETYTKDYIQLSKKAKFLETVGKLFPVAVDAEGSVPLTYKWPGGMTTGAFVYNSADRPHLKWETSLGAPNAWKMAPFPSDATAETIPGNPSHANISGAESEFALLASRGAGQPYLLAIKLRNEPRTLHLRAYLKNPSNKYEWANLGLVPQEVQDLAAKTSQQSALASALFHSDGSLLGETVGNVLSQLAASEDRSAMMDAFDIDMAHSLTSYLRRPGHGLFFDPSKNHDAWLVPAPLSTQLAASVDDLLQALEARFPTPTQDAAAEALEADPQEVQAFREKIEQKNYEVVDSTTTVKTRGSAQRAFAQAVKTNYGYACAITGIATKDFLVASHIVPWSEDQSIRLDPSNGICLSLLVDRAFEKGFLQIADDLMIWVDSEKIGNDQALRDQLEPYHGQKLSVPSKQAPHAGYLHRRRQLITETIGDGGS